MAKKATKKKIVNLPRKSKFTKMAEERKVGEEVVDWSNVTDIETAMRDTLRHYSYFNDYKDANRWLLSWAKVNLPKKDYQLIKNCEVWRTSLTLGGLCKMHSNNAPLPAQQRLWMMNKIKEMMDHSEDRKNQKAEAVFKARTPADIVKERTSELIAEIEEVIDQYDTKRHNACMEFSVYDMLTKEEAAYNTSKAIVDYYTPLYKELEELAKGKDKELNEAYPHMKPAARKKFRDFVQKIVEDAEKYQLAKKATRKTPVRKAKSVSSQVSKVKFKTRDDSLKVVSIDPSKIIGAKIVFLYNTKYKRLTKLITNASKGFEIQGTTIQNVDLECSQKKTIRKPEENLGKFCKGTKAKMETEFDKLKTKPSEANGRINAETIILRVF